MTQNLITFSISKGHFLLSTPNYVFFVYIYTKRFILTLHLNNWMPYWTNKQSLLRHCRQIGKMYKQTNTPEKKTVKLPLEFYVKWDRALNANVIFTSFQNIYYVQQQKNWLFKLYYYVLHKFRLFKQLQKRCNTHRHTIFDAFWNSLVCKKNTDFTQHECKQSIQKNSKQTHWVHFCDRKIIFWLKHE